ncbi:MAG: N-6 DNA methylase, partial [Halobacteriaceae archaeon]
YPSYSQNVAPQDAEIQRRILRSFDGVELKKIQPQSARAFIRIIESSRQSSESMTPLDVADALVDLAGPEQDDRVMDPAAGIGNSIRGAALRGADATAIEINPKTTNVALFLNAVNDVDVEYVVADFLQEDLADTSGPTLSDFGDDNQQDSTALPVNQDHVLIDPPFGLHYERPDGSVERNAEESFVLKSLRCLRSEGTVTAVLPQGSLYKQNSKDFREELRQDFWIKTIIEINKPVFQQTALPTVIVQIQNQPAPPNTDLQYAIVEKSDDEEELNRAVERINNEDAPTLTPSELGDGSYLPSEIVGVNQVTDQLGDRFGEIAELQERANEIRTGVKPGDTVSESRESTVPFLRPQDVSQGSVSQYLPRDEEEVTAGPKDVLVSVKGDTSVVYTPSTEVVPASNWAIIRFDSHDEALVYATFFESEIGQKQLSAIRTGATIPYIPLRRLKEVYVPVFTDSQIDEKADQIRSLRKTAQQYERQRTAIEDQIEDIVGGDLE